MDGNKMIPADHITFEGDTAWWAVDQCDGNSEGWAMTIDRPCRMCNGTRKAYPEHLRGGLVALDTVPGYDPADQHPRP